MYTEKKCYVRIAPHSSEYNATLYSNIYTDVDVYSSLSPENNAENTPLHGKGLCCILNLPDPFSLETNYV